MIVERRQTQTERKKVGVQARLGVAADDEHLMEGRDEVLHLEAHGSLPVTEVPPEHFFGSLQVQRAQTATKAGRVIPVEAGINLAEGGDEARVPLRGPERGFPNQQRGAAEGLLPQIEQGRIPVQQLMKVQLDELRRALFRRERY